MSEQKQKAQNQQKITGQLNLAIGFLKQKPWILIAIIVSLLLLYFFWIGFVALFLVGIIVLVLKRLFFLEDPLKAKLNQKSLLMGEIKIAETKLLQHKIDQKAFEEIAERNQKMLVDLEASIQRETAVLDEKKQKQELNQISSKRRHLLKDLLEKKEMIQNEIRIAETKYFKRKITTETYKQLLEGKQKELIKLEAEIKKIYSDESIEKIKSDLSKKLSALEKTDAEERKDFSEQVFDDVAEQERKAEREKKEQSSR